MTTEARPRSLAVIGGAGFLGRSLIGRLSSTDVAVRCLDRVAFPAGAPRPAGFQEFVGEAADPELLKGALDGAEAVWIRAAMLGGGASAEASRIG